MCESAFLRTIASPLLWQTFSYVNPREFRSGRIQVGFIGGGGGGVVIAAPPALVEVA